MDIGNPIIYNCPSCKKPMLETRYISDSFYSTAIFSDGRRWRYPLYPLSTPDLAKCPNCGALFFVHNLKGKQTKFEDDTSGYEEFKEPELEDYIKAVGQKLYKTTDEEIQARKLLWRWLNDIMRKGGKFTDEQMKLWQDNCAAMLSLLETFLAKLNKDGDESYEWGIIDDYSMITELTITVAELQRNLEQFDECVKTIKNIPKDGQWLKDKFLQQCKSHNRFVFVIKEHEDYE